MVINENPQGSIRANNSRSILKADWFIALVVTAFILVCVKLIDNVFENYDFLDIVKMVFFDVVGIEIEGQFNWFFWDSSLPVILAASFFVAFIRSSSAESLISRSMRNQSESLAIVIASLAGALSPFGSLQVLPLIASLLLMGVPLPAVIAFWLSSPLIDPAMLVITADVLGWQFSIAKCLAAVATGLVAGYATSYLINCGVVFEDEKKIYYLGNLETNQDTSISQEFEWKIWESRSRLVLLCMNFGSQLVFFLSWMTVGYLIQNVMITYAPFDFLTFFSNSFDSTVYAALLGAPLYLHGVAAPPIIASFINVGMQISSATAFLIAGSAVSLPALIIGLRMVSYSTISVYAVCGIISGLLSGLVFASFVTIT